MLDVRRMRILREVAEHGSIARAARSLSFTPSAVSQQIAALERETGVALVERAPRRVRLTEAGRALVAHTDAILARLASAEADIHAIAGLGGGTLRLASFPTAYATLVPPAIGEFRRRHPAVELALTEADPVRALDKVASGELDVALVYEYDFVPLPPSPGVELVHLLDDPVNVILPRSHPAARNAVVRLDAFARDSWITSTSRSACHSFVARACRAAGFEPRVTMESDDHGVWQGLVAAGMGVALASELSLPHVDPAIAVRSVSPRPLKRKIHAAHRAGAAASPAIAEILAILRDVASAREPVAATG